MMDLGSAPKNNASIAKRVFKKVRSETRDNHGVATSEVVRRTRLFVMYERPAGASPINGIWSILIKGSLQ